MPLTLFQKKVGKLLSKNRSEDNYLAGGAALLLQPQSVRFSQDLDFFQDSIERVASAFSKDERLLKNAGCSIDMEINQPGYLRAVVKQKDEATKIEWARDSNWRFMPVVKNLEFGFVLHPVDLATNKVLALAGRDEPRDLIDTIHIHNHILSLGPLVWAAVGKDPGFSPNSLLELLKRRGKVRPEDLNRLHLSEKINLHEIKETWLDALAQAEIFVNERPFSEAGCLYYSSKSKSFVNPEDTSEKITVHFGRPGGVLPKIIEQ